MPSVLRRVKTLPVSTRLWLVVGFVSAIVLADNLLDIRLHGKRLRAEKELKLEQLVDTAHSILEYYEGQAREGRLPEADARRLAIESIRPLRYSEVEYFWIHDLGRPTPRMVMHPTMPELDGTLLDSPTFARATSSRSGRQGPEVELQGVNLFLAMNEVALSREGQGFVTYDWPKPLEGGGVTAQLYPKLSFVKRFERWDWVIGSGIYMDEFEAAYWRQMRLSLTKGGAWLVLFAFLVWAILRTIVRPLRDLQTSIERLHDDPDGHVAPAGEQPQELGQLADSFRDLMDRLQHSRRALNASFENLRKITSRAPGVVFQFRLRPDGSSCVPFASEAIRDTFRVAPEEVRDDAAPVFAVVHPDDLPALLASIEASARDLTPWHHEYRLKFEGESDVWLGGSAVPEREADGSVLWHGFITDVTRQKHTEEALRVAATAFESQEGMIITDAHGTILRVNRAFTEITGYEVDEAVGEKMSLLKSGRHDAAFYAAMWEGIQRDGSWQGEVWNRRKNGEVYAEWLTITAVKDKRGSITHYVGALTDITLRKAAEDEIKHLAFYDPLTRLPNRRLLLDRLHQALASSSRNGRNGALLFIDLDNFKTLNDTLGHDVGDLLLQQVAHRLTACVREGDTVARLGGDEFVVMLEDLSASRPEAASRAEGVAEKILASLNRRYLLAGHQHRSTPSIGVTLYGEQRETVEELLKRADLAMYQAKSAGRNAVRFFDPEMQAAVIARAEIEVDLRLGLKQKRFLLHYQPQVDETGRMTGVEALVRWRHPRRGMVPPDEFIPIAEESGLIVPLGQWVLQAACAQLVAWAGDEGKRHLTVAVNVSAHQFRHPDFVGQVLSALETSGADPHKLKLELTESLLLDDVEDVIGKMAMLKARGVGFSLDDFGTGYSSLSYLKRLPLEQLKIDKFFVNNVLTDTDGAAIARTIVALAHSMDLKVIAEGVETEEQHGFLAGEGCQAFQGYLFGRPMPAEELGAYLRARPTAPSAQPSARRV